MNNKKVQFCTQNVMKSFTPSTAIIGLSVIWICVSINGMELLNGRILFCSKLFEKIIWISWLIIPVVIYLLIFKIKSHLIKDLALFCGILSITIGAFTSVNQSLISRAITLISSGAFDSLEILDSEKVTENSHRYKYRINNSPLCFIRDERDLCYGIKWIKTRKLFSLPVEVQPSSTTLQPKI